MARLDLRPHTRADTRRVIGREPLEVREEKGTVLQGGGHGPRGCRRESVTDEKAWREALGDDGFFQAVTDEVVSKGIGGFILTGLPEPKKPEPGD